jgi:hypothetical protein
MPKFLVASNDAVSPDNYCDTSLNNLKDKIRKRLSTAWTIRVYDFTFGLPNMCRFIEGDIPTIEKYTIKVDDKGGCRREEFRGESVSAPATEGEHCPKCGNAPCTHAWQCPPGSAGPDDFGGEDTPHAPAVATITAELAQLPQPIVIPPPKAAPVAQPQSVVTPKPLATTLNSHPVIQRRRA